MKKIITLGLVLASTLFTATAASAQNYDPQRDRYEQNRRNDRDWRDDRNWRNNRVRTVTQTRIVRQGFRTFRETLRITYLPNGRTRTQIINRVRIR